MKSKLLIFLYQAQEETRVWIYTLGLFLMDLLALARLFWVHILIVLVACLVAGFWWDWHIRGGYEPLPFYFQHVWDQFKMWVQRL